MVILAMVFCFSIYLFSQSRNERILTVEQKFAEKFEGFDTGTVVRIEYIDDQDVISDTVQIDTEETVFTENQDFLVNRTGLYSVFYSIEKELHNIADINLSTNSDAGALSAEFSGLPSGTKIGLSIGQNSYYSDINVDWAGNLVLDVENPVQSSWENICFDFKDSRNQSHKQICHRVTKKVEGYL